MKWETFDSYDALSVRAAEIFLGAIHANPRIVFGLPTGRTPIGMYDRIVAICSREYHCFTEVTTFNLDEYVGISCEHPGSYCTYMREHLFEHVDIDRRSAHIPNGNAADLIDECMRYERTIRNAGGLGLTFLGLGRNGHIGFNEPGTPFQSRTRVVSLTQSTRTANASCFADGEVPKQAMTMGIGTILESKSIVLLVSGTGKEDAVARLRSGEINEEFPASALHLHGDVQVLVS
ncbi:MAG TPA: glucosamine-6-phosphate deaminase [Thermoanaerobaculia bacterium]|nr:glucosamine-6-phosphate deaminase [Thermoanaerobaculia bacterium]